MSECDLRKKLGSVLIELSPVRTTINIVLEEALVGVEKGRKGRREQERIRGRAGWAARKKAGNF